VLPMPVLDRGSTYTVNTVIYMVRQEHSTFKASISSSILFSSAASSFCLAVFCRRLSFWRSKPLASFRARCMIFLPWKIFSPARFWTSPIETRLLGPLPWSSVSSRCRFGIVGSVNRPIDTDTKSRAGQESTSQRNAGMKHSGRAAAYRDTSQVHMLHHHHHHSATCSQPQSR